MNTKIVDFAKKIKYELGILALLAFQLLLNCKQIGRMSDMYLPYYLADFSMGKTSRLLVGEFINLLTDHPTEKWLNGFALVFLFAAIALLVVVLGRVVRAVDAEKRVPVYVFILFFCTGSFTTHIFSWFFGMLDVHMLILAVVSLVFLNNKYLRWLVPVLCLAGVMINYVFGVSYFPIIVLFILYLADSSDKKAGNIILFCITVISVVALTFYCIIFAVETTTVTFDHMVEIMERKLGAPITGEQAQYVSGYLTGKLADGTDVLGYDMAEMGAFEVTYNLFRYILTERMGFDGVISLVLASFPIIAVFWAIWIMSIKNAEKGSKKFIFVCFILSTLFIPICCLLSTDLIRWISAGVLTQFGLCFYMFYKHDAAFGKTVEQIQDFLKDKKIVLITAFLAYAFIRHLELGTGR